MKCKTIWEVNIGEALTAKRRTMVTINQELEDEAVTSVNHITIIEDTKEEPPIKDDTEDAPPSFEEGVQTIVDELKEVNIGTTEDHRPVFINESLSQEEEDAYVKLLKEYKDVFAWTYKEMPGLNPKIVVHHLSIRHGVRPTKQAQHRFQPELISQIEGEVNKLIKAGFIREVK